MPILRKKKLVFLVLLLLLLLLSLGAMGYFMLIHSYRKVEYYTLARQAYQNGDLGKAKSLMIQEISQDPNNEQAITTLAGWLDREGSFFAAAQLWLRAVNLNAFKVEYTHNARSSLFLSRNFEQYYSACSNVNVKVPLTKPEKLQYAYSAFNLAKVNEASNIFQTVEGESVLALPLAQLLAVFLPLKEPRDQALEEQQIRALLPALTDQFIRYECLLWLHFYALQKKDGEADAEDILQDAVQLNPRDALPIMGNFYYRRNRFAKAAAAYQAARLLRPYDINMLAWAAESLLLSEQTQELQRLAREFKPEGREELLCSYYLEALLAFVDRDGKKMALALERSDQRFRSPLAQVLSLGANVFRDNHRDVLQIAAGLAEDGKLLEFRARADRMLFPYLSQLLKEERDADAAELARVMQINRQPELILTRLDIQDKFRLGTLQRNEIARALQSFPTDPSLLFYSSTLFLRMTDYKNALQEGRRLQALQPESIEAGLLVIAALDAMLDFSAVEEEFAQYRQKFPTDTLLLENYWNFCSNLKRLDSLQKLSQDLQKQNAPETLSYIPVIEAEVAFLRADTQKAIELLQGFQSDNPEQLYHAAYILARGGQHLQAIALYRQIPPQFSRYELTQLNLSELLAEEGENNQALAVARQAWLNNPDSLLVRECYGIRLHENGEAMKAIEILDAVLLSQNNNARVAEAWRKSMYKQISALFAAKDYRRGREICERVLLHFTNDTQATELLAQAMRELEKKQQEQAGNAAGAQAE